MKRTIVSRYMQLEEKLAGYVAVMNFRFMNLCVQAEEVSLLPVEVTIEGEKMKFEDVADAAKKNDYEFMVFPKFEDDLMEVGKGIALVHPEFKQKIEELPVESVDESGQPVVRNVKYILVTMPDVDDERYDVLNDGAKAVYEECKAQMEVTNNRAQVDFAQLTAGEPKEDVELLKKKIDKLNEDKATLRDKLYEEKRQEIMDAYNKWLAGFAQQEVHHMEEEDAHGKDVVTRMKMVDAN